MKIPIFTKGIFLLIALFFTLGIYLSIPVLFNYKSIENIIESKFYSDFDIKLNINGDITVSYTHLTLPTTEAV